MAKWLCVVCVLGLFSAAGGGVGCVLAQTPTPPPTPTATILETPGGTIVVYPAITQGEAAVLVGLIFLCGLLLLSILLQVVEWLKS